MTCVSKHTVRKFAEVRQGMGNAHGGVTNLNTEVTWISLDSTYEKQSLHM
jgi:hypothetical protein